MSPTYDTFCDSCKKYFELFSKIAEIDNMVCPVCTKKISIVISKAPPFKFNADGFHKTDYVKDGRKDRTPKSYYEQREKLKSIGKLEDVNSELNKIKNS